MSLHSHGVYHNTSLLFPIRELDTTLPRVRDGIKVGLAWTLPTAFAFDIRNIQLPSFLLNSKEEMSTEKTMVEQTLACLFLEVVEGVYPTPQLRLSQHIESQYGTYQ
jgi:hypothetical protein